MELLGVLVLERKSLDWQRLGKQRTWWKSRGTRSSYLWSWWRDHGRRLWRISQEIWEVERLSQPNCRWVVWDSSWVIFGLTGWNLAVLQLGCFSGLTLFGQSCRMNRPEIAHQNKARQILESKDWWWAKLQGWWSIRLQIVCYNHIPKCFEITLEASDIILLMFSNNL
jgi:hypothetical protein